jgi:hypothetical protein
MRRSAIRFLVFAVLAVFWFVPCLSLRAASPRPNTNVPVKNAFADDEGKEPVRVLKVLSGDTLQIVCKGQQETVRLEGLDLSGKDTGRAAEDVRRLAGLLKGKSVEVATGSSPEQERDQQGRRFVTLYAEGENINEMLRTMERFGFDAVTETLPDKLDPPPVPRSSSPPPPPAKKTKTGLTVIGKVTYERVYVTPRDKTYHKANCRLLSGVRAVPVLKEYAVQQGYNPCRRCKP